MTCDPRELAREALKQAEGIPDGYVMLATPSKVQALARAVLEMSDAREQAEGLLRGMEFIEHREDGNVWCSYCDSSADIPSALLHRYGWCVVPRIARYFEEGKRDGNL